MTDTDRLADRPGGRPVVQHTLVHHGHVWDLVTETVDLGESRVVRDFVDHPGAVAVIALDDDDRVLLLSQYRHPARTELWEPPAGLLDVPEEPHVDAAARELAEEADLSARSWWRLVEFFTSPGGSNERIVVFLARGLEAVADGDRYTRVDEEAEMVPLWVPLDQAVEAALTGRLQSPTAVTGILAASAARARGWDTLQPVSPTGAHG